MAGEKFERARVRLYGHLESHLEDARLKLSSCLSDCQWAADAAGVVPDFAVDPGRAELIDQQIAQLDHSLSKAPQKHNEAVVRLAEVPGYGAEAAQQVIAEVGPEAAAFPSAGQLVSGLGAGPEREESAEVSRNNNSPKGKLRMCAHTASSKSCPIPTVIP